MRGVRNEAGFTRVVEKWEEEVHLFRMLHVPIIFTTGMKRYVLVKEIARFAFGSHLKLQFGCWLMFWGQQRLKQNQGDGTLRRCQLPGQVPGEDGRVEMGEGVLAHRKLRVSEEKKKNSALLNCEAGSVRTPCPNGVVPGVSTCVGIGQLDGSEK